MASSMMPSLQNPGPLTKKGKIAIAHAALAGVAFLIVFPAGIVISRYLRRHKWVWAHAAFQMVATAITIAVFALGYRIRTSLPHFGKDEGSHTLIGLVLLVLVLVQSIGGWLVRLTSPLLSKDGRVVSASPSRLLHIALGLAILGLGYYNVWTGLEYAWMRSGTYRRVPHVVFVLYWVLMGVAVAVYLVGIMKGVRDHTMAKPKHFDAQFSDTDQETIVGLDNTSQEKVVNRKSYPERY